MSKEGSVVESVSKEFGGTGRVKEIMESREVGVVNNNLDTEMIESGVGGVNGGRKWRKLGREKPRNSIHDDDVVGRGKNDKRERDSFMTMEFVNKKLKR